MLSMNQKNWLENKKILILGAQGMLGRDLNRVFSEFNPVCWDKKDVDISNQSDLEKKLKDLSPNIVINAAAYTAVDLAEDQKELANQVNGQGVGYLAKIAKEICAILVHFSTDYVFSGAKKEGYQEDDHPNPINAYGRSKLLGEQLLLKNSEMYYLIRTSWLYGRNGKNFVNTMINLAKEKKEISVVNDQFGKPTFTLDLARATRQLLQEQFPCGIYHLPNENETSWYQFAKKIFELSGVNIEVTPITTKDYPTRAARPKYSSLINTKFPLLRSWPDALIEYLKNL